MKNQRIAHDLLRAILDARESLRVRLGSRLPSLCRELGAIVDHLPANLEDDDWRRLAEGLRRLLMAYGIFDIGARTDVDSHELPPNWRAAGESSSPGHQSRSFSSGPLAHHVRQEILQFARAEERSIPHASDRITTCPEVKVPDVVSLGEPFDISISLREGRIGDEASGIELALDEHGLRELEVEILPADSEAFDVRSVPLTGRLAVGASGNSASLVFRLVGRACGTHSIDAAFRQGRVELLRLTIRVHVQIAPAVAPVAPPRTTTALVEISGNSSDDVVVLRIDPRFSDGPTAAWSIRLLAPAELLPFERSLMQDVPASMQALLVEQCRRMEHDFATNSPKVLEGRLRRMGSNLARTLLPAELQRDLHRLPEGISLHIESNDAWVPWEMVRLGDADNGFFLGERFAVTRWLREGSRQQRLRRSPTVLVAPTDSRLSVGAERNALTHLSGAVPMELRTLEDVSDLLDGALNKRYGRCAFLHFVAHGETAPNDPHGGRVLLQRGQKLLVTDITPPNATEGTTELDAPLMGSCVFLNACQTGIGGQPTLTGHGGWATVFARAGAAAFIAPSWSVFDHTASRFAEALYEALSNGVSLGEAARRARRWAKEEGNPDRLAYAVFALPNTRVEECRQVAG